jgi:sigma54-dependent transcription regulator
MAISNATTVQVVLTCSPGWKIHEQFLGRCQQDELASQRVEWTVIPPEELRPDVSGVTPHYSTRTAEIFLRNLHAFLANDLASMVNVVDKQAGY